MPQPLDTQPKIDYKSVGQAIAISVRLQGIAQELVENALASQKQELISKFEKAFKEKYQGVGEVFFPYESEGNCTKAEEEQYIHQEWLDLRTKLQELKESTL